MQVEANKGNTFQKIGENILTQQHKTNTGAFPPEKGYIAKAGETVYNGASSVVSFVASPFVSKKEVELTPEQKIVVENFAALTAELAASGTTNYFTKARVIDINAALVATHGMLKNTPKVVEEPKKEEKNEEKKETTTPATPATAADTPAATPAPAAVAPAPAAAAPKAPAVPDWLFNQVKLVVEESKKLPIVKKTEGSQTAEQEAAAKAAAEATKELVIGQLDAAMLQWELLANSAETTTRDIVDSQPTVVAKSVLFEGKSSWSVAGDEKKTNVTTSLRVAKWFTEQFNKTPITVGGVTVTEKDWKAFVSHLATTKGSEVVEPLFKKLALVSDELATSMFSASIFHRSTAAEYFEPAPLVITAVNFLPDAENLVVVTGTKNLKGRGGVTLPLEFTFTGPRVGNKLVVTASGV